MVLSSTLPPSLQLRHLWPVADQVEALQHERAQGRDAQDVPAPDFRGAAQEAQSTTAREWIISGPYETGKTWAALWRLDAEARHHAGAQYAIVRKVRADMDGSVLVTWKKLIGMSGSGAAPFGGERPQWYDYPNGARVWIGGLDRPEKTLSGERDGIYVNQAEELDEHDWETIGTRTTGRGAVTPHPMLFGDCNPGAEDHWIIRRRDAGTLTLLESRHEDNPALFLPDRVTLTEQGERTMAILDALTGVRYQRGRLGRWVGAEGMYFTQLHADRHLVPRPAFQGWPVWAALDYGFSHPLSFGVFTQDQKDRVYLLGRHAQHKWYIPQHVRAIDELLDGLGIDKRVLRVVAGHDCWATGHDDPETIADKFAKVGYPLERAIISRVIGARAVGERLGNPESKVPPSLFFCDKGAFDALARMVHDPRNTEDVLKVNADAEGRGGDDDYDMVRYGVMAATQAIEVRRAPPVANRWKAL
jgi:hypothetical protein